MTTVFFDFLCPYAWRGVELANALGGAELFGLRHFSLLEGNHRDNAHGLHWRLTDQSPQAEGENAFLKGQRPSLGAFLAAQAARRTGPTAEWAFTLALFRAHHEHGQPLDESAFVEAARTAARTAALDLDAWYTARANVPALLSALRADLDLAADVGVQGTPTFALPSGAAAYFRCENLTRDPNEAARRWALFTAVLDDPARIGTIKRAKHRPA